MFISRNRLKTCSGLIVITGLLTMISGCGDDSPSLYPVKGSVKLGDKPMPGGSVTLVADKAKGNTSTIQPRGDINSQGEYTISTNGKPGAPLGAYKVLVAEEAPVTSDNTKVVATKRKSTYLSADITPLSFEVVKSPAPGAYDLKLQP